MQSLKNLDVLIEDLLKDTLTPPEFLILGQQNRPKYTFSLIDMTGAGWFTEQPTLAEVAHNCNYHEFFDAVIKAYSLTPHLISSKLRPRGVIIFEKVDDIPKYLNNLTDHKPSLEARSNLENRPYVVLSHIETPENRIIPHKNTLRTRLPENVYLF